MAGFRQGFQAVLALFYALLFVFGCTHITPSSTSNTETEFWEMKTTGDTEGEYKLLLRRVEIEKGVYSISGEFSGTATDIQGGAGEMVCTFHGEIRKDAIAFHFTGTGQFARKVSLGGDMKGSLSGSRASGVWDMVHDEGCSAGEWAMRRTGPPQ